MDLIKKITEIYKNEDNQFITQLYTYDSKIANIYGLYHFYNDDVTKLDELNSCMCDFENEFATLRLINDNVTSEKDSIDFIFTLDDYDVLEDDELLHKCLQICATTVANIILKDRNKEYEELISIYEGLGGNIDSFYNIIRLIVTKEIPVEAKFKLQQKVAEYRVKAENFLFEMFFLDDVQYEIEDIESPKECVSKGEFELADDTTICMFGEEKSFVTLIKASSLKTNYIKYVNKGLLSSNLRYFVPSKKIDPKIINSIKNDSDNFVYYNNGIIITCDDYKLKNRVLELTNFSIVNGGQTTNLVGRTFFEKDFSIMCKVIKNKYDDIQEKVQFLSKVAEASNMQKPINAKDLIANKIEQRLLKIQFAEAGIFLKIKRGEKIDLSQYKEKWQNASNDEIAQMLYSVVYQSPGSAKNSKSKLLETEKIYNIIFKNNYSNEFFISLQKLKIAFNEYQKKIKKTESVSSIKYGITKHANFFTLGLVGIFYKLMTNVNVSKYFSENPIERFNANNENLREQLQQNDIGSLIFIKKEVHDIITKSTFDSLFNIIMDYILVPAYRNFKENYTYYSYAHFCKSDMYYYNYVLPQVYKMLKGTEFYKIKNLSSTYFDLSQKAENKTIEKEVEMSKTFASLEEELREYRKNQSKRDNIEAYKIFSDKQLVYILKYLPKSKNDLIEYCKINSLSVSKYGDDIMKIMENYVSIKNYI